MVYQLSLVFFVEGSSDTRFLVTLVQRTIQDLLIRQGKMSVDLLPPEVKKKK